MDNHIHLDFIGEGNRFRFMKKLYLFLLFVFVGSICKSNAQYLTESQIPLEIHRLVLLKLDYEKFKNRDKKRDSVLALYKEQINKIKRGSDLYSKYIKTALRRDKDSLKRERIPYKYISGGQSIYDVDEYVIKKIDLYRIIKYYLLEQNDELLPESFRGLPIIDEKSYNGYYNLKPGELKRAIKFIIATISLSKEEITFVKSERSPKAIMDIKEYIDANGLNPESEKFIKWAINYLTKNNSARLGELEIIYRVVNSKDYVPRDRKPDN